MQKKEQVVIVGFGWVGQANALALAAMGYPVSYFDPSEPPRHYPAQSAGYGELKRLIGLAELDSPHTVYIVCVGDRVSEEGVQDISNIKSALDVLKEVQGVVVLRSTVLPDFLEKLPFDYYVPEFLHEKTAVEECLSPHFFVVGVGNTQKKEPGFFSEWRKQTPKQFIGSPREAAFIKYLSNLWNATRIAFVNEFGDTITTPNSREGVESIHRIVDFVLEGEAYQRYGKAFGGHCLPKDLRAFTHWYGTQGKPMDFLRGTYDSNKKHQEMEGKYKNIPEWFSSWPTPHLSGFVALQEFTYSVKKNLKDPREFIRRYQTSLLLVASLLIILDIILFYIL